jgi:hypothetical protein
MKKTLTITTLLAVTCAVSLAQDKKLKDVQEVSLWAPAGVKADGKLVEWNDSFQAYNKATKLYYTISNDEKNIYLAIKSTDAMNNNKIVAGAITIAINTEGKKKTENTYKITYPVIAPITMQRGAGGPIGGGPAGGGGAIMMVGGPGGGGGAGGAGGMRAMMGGGAPGEPLDSATIAIRKKALLTYKEIKVSGFKDIPDSLISLYNEHGVKTMANYDDQGNFLYEVAIPLKLMGLEPGSTNELAYNVKLNGLQIPSLGNIDMMGGGGLGGGGADPGGPGVGTVNIRMNGGGGFAGSGGGGRRSGGTFNFQEMISPSDFWGKYVLAKK